MLVDGADLEQQLHSFQGNDLLSAAAGSVEITCCPNAGPGEECCILDFETGEITCCQDDFVPCDPSTLDEVAPGDLANCSNDCVTEWLDWMGGQRAAKGCAPLQVKFINCDDTQCEGPFGLYDPADKNVIYICVDKFNQQMEHRCDQFLITLAHETSHALDDCLDLELNLLEQPICMQEICSELRAAYWFECTAFPLDSIERYSCAVEKAGNSLVDEDVAFGEDCAAQLVEMIGDAVGEGSAIAAIVKSCLDLLEEEVNAGTRPDCIFPVIPDPPPNPDPDPEPDPDPTPKPRVR